MKKAGMVVLILFLIPVLAQARIDTIIIDPGHGGRDPGAINKSLNLMEKDVNLSIAFALKEMIGKRFPSMRVHLTRSDDSYLTLDERVSIANSFHQKRAILISVHTNSHNRSVKVEGVEVFYYSRPQSQIKIKRRETIRKEVINDFSDYLKPALSELINEKIKMDSKILAKTIARGLSMASREPIRKISSASFYVVSYPVIPAVLVEVGFIQSKKFLKSYYQKKIAKGILVGILAFIKKENKF